MLGQIRINLLLNFGYLIHVLDADAPRTLMPWKRAALLKARRLLDKVSGRRRLDRELETTIDVCLKHNTHGHILIEFRRAIVELLAELHHIDTEGAESLTDLRARLCVPRNAVDAHCRFVRWTRVHLSFTSLIINNKQLIWTA